jgi:hypothetical protein
MFDPLGLKLRRENHRLMELNRDLHLQLQSQSQARTLSPGEEERIARLREDFRTQNEEVNAIALWLRANKAKEIAQGRHVGLKFSEVVIMYMARGLDRQ